MRYFISYTDTDVDDGIRERIQKQLEQAGHEVFIDKGIEAGEDWQKKIADQIEICDVFVPLLSTISMERNWIKKECVQAMKRHREFEAPEIVPVLINRDLAQDKEESLHQFPCFVRVMSKKLQFKSWKEGVPDNDKEVIDACFTAAVRAYPLEKQLAKIAEDWIGTIEEDDTPLESKPYKMPLTGAINYAVLILWHEMLLSGWTRAFVSRDESEAKRIDKKARFNLKMFPRGTALTEVFREYSRRVLNKTNECRTQLTIKIIEGNTDDINGKLKPIVFEDQGAAPPALCVSVDLWTLLSPSIEFTTHVKDGLEELYEDENRSVEDYSNEEIALARRTKSIFDAMIEKQRGKAIDFIIEKNGLEDLYKAVSELSPQDHLDRYNAKRFGDEKNSNESKDEITIGLHFELLKLFLAFLQALAYFMPDVRNIYAFSYRLANDKKNQINASNEQEYDRVCSFFCHATDGLALIANPKLEEKSDVASVMLDRAFDEVAKILDDVDKAFMRREEAKRDKESRRLKRRPKWKRQSDDQPVRENIGPVIDYLIPNELIPLLSDLAPKYANEKRDRLISPYHRLPRLKEYEQEFLISLFLAACDLSRDKHHSQACSYTFILGKGAVWRAIEETISEENPETDFSDDEFPRLIRAHRPIFQQPRIAAFIDMADRLHLQKGGLRLSRMVRLKHGQGGDERPSAVLRYVTSIPGNQNSIALHTAGDGRVLLYQGGSLLCDWDTSTRTSRPLINRKALDAFARRTIGILFKDDVNEDQQIKHLKERTKASLENTLIRISDIDGDGCVLVVSSDEQVERLKKYFVPMGGVEDCCMKWRNVNSIKGTSETLLSALFSQDGATLISPQGIKSRQFVYATDSGQPNLNREGLPLDRDTREHVALLLTKTPGFTKGGVEIFSVAKDGPMKHWTAESLADRGDR